VIEPSSKRVGINSKRIFILCVMTRFQSRVRLGDGPRTATLLALSAAELVIVLACGFSILLTIVPCIDANRSIVLESTSSFEDGFSQPLAAILRLRARAPLC
jgi:hypothetical protein